MSMRYAGQGTLLKDNRHVDEVEYAFTLDHEHGFKGELWSVDQYLPQRTTFRLLLNDPPHYIEVQFGSGILDMSRMQFRYLMQPAPGQPDNPYNLVQKSAVQAQQNKAESE